MTLFSTAGQFYLFLWSLSFGCIIGIFYEVCVFFRRLFKFRLYINIIFDLIFAGLTTGLFLLYFTYVCNFQIRFFIFLGIIPGFFSERISIGKLIAKICDMLYNTYSKIKKQYIEKNNKRKLRKEQIKLKEANSLALLTGDKIDKSGI